PIEPTQIHAQEAVHERDMPLPIARGMPQDNAAETRAISRASSEARRGGQLRMAATTIQLGASALRVASSLPRLHRSELSVEPTLAPTHQHPESSEQYQEGCNRNEAGPRGSNVATRREHLRRLGSTHLLNCATPQLALTDRFRARA